MRNLLKYGVLLIFMLNITGLSAKNIGNESIPDTINIKDAIAKKLLKFRITGLDDPRVFHEVIDNDGAYYGKCMVFVLQSEIDSLIYLNLDCGTMLIPLDSTYQTMIVTQSVQFPLFPNKIYATRFYAMCGQMNNAPPYVGSFYSIGSLANSNILKLTHYFEKHHIQNMVGQHALWSYTDKAGYKELEENDGDSITIAMTIKLLNDVGLKTELTKTVNNAEQIVQPNTQIIVQRNIVYGAVGLIFILLITTIILVVRKK